MTAEYMYRNAVALYRSFASRIRSVRVTRLGSRVLIPAIASVITVNLSGCAPYFQGRDLPRTRGEVLNQSGALLVGSVTNPDPHNGTHADIKFFFRQVNGSEHFYVRNAPHAGLLSGPEREADPGLEGIAGKLFAVTVAPGEYELTRVNIWLQFSGDVEFEPRPRLKVGPGEVFYIGNLEVTNCYSLYIAPNGERRRETVVGGFVDVRNEVGRDLPVLRRTFPHLHEATIVERVLDRKALAAGGADKLARPCAYERGENN